MFDNIDNPSVDIICKYISSTDKAILVEVDGERDWIPISQINDLSVELHTLERGDPLTITIPEWLAEEKGF
jgi:hypothetical protein